MLHWSHQLSHDLFGHLDTMLFFKVLQTLSLLCHWKEVLGCLEQGNFVGYEKNMSIAHLSVHARCHPIALQGLSVLCASALG